MAPVEEQAGSCSLGTPSKSTRDPGRTTSPNRMHSYKSAEWLDSNIFTFYSLMLVAKLPFGKLIPSLHAHQGTTRGPISLHSY